MDSPETAEQAWRDKAACVGADPRIFTDPRPDSSDVRRAVGICQTCPVKQPCLETALRIEPAADVGIWGGTTPHTRKGLRRTRHDQAALPSAVRAPSEPAPGTTSTTGTRDPLELRVDEHGDYIDRTGRVIIFEIHGEPPFMLMIDGKPRARTANVHDAAGLAGHLLQRDQPPLATWPEAGKPRREVRGPALRRV